MSKDILGIRKSMKEREIHKNFADILNDIIRTGRPNYYAIPELIAKDKLTGEKYQQEETTTL